jgi:CII-binding regulator of phage lambda lysogenization HflD
MDGPVPDPTDEGWAAARADKRVLSLVFQEMAHLTASMVQLEKRLHRLDHTMNRTQDRLTDFQTKFQKRLLGVEVPEAND